MRRSLFSRTSLKAASPACQSNPSIGQCRHASSKADAEAVAFDQEAARRRRKTEWKRKQGGQTFLDHLIVTVRGGKGGDGCAAFHREKFKPFGPPSGGNGGRGGDVYLLPTPHLTTLSSVPKKVRGNSGGHGQGTWQNGKAGPPLVIKVPLGTVVREIPRGDTRRAPDEWESEEESLADLSPAEKRAKMREHRWVHYPRSGDDNVERDSFKEAENAFYKMERERRLTRRKREMEEPMIFDLDKEEVFEQPDDAPLGVRHQQPLGHLIASGGLGGLGNPHFLTEDNRSPKFATRGQEGERITLSLELKLLADIGLVGMPNVGKSTLLRALTGGRAKSEVAGYAFTTLNPIVGVVRVAEDGTFEGGLTEGLVHEETLIEENRERQKLINGEYAHTPTRNQLARRHENERNDAHEDKLNEEDSAAFTSAAGHQFDLLETFRFTIADNPGLISRASENVGLGHSFLRSMERSLALAYVVDLSGPAPWDELVILRDELEKYQPSMSAKARMVVANKADLLGGDGGCPVAIEEARCKLARLEEFVRTELTPHRRAGSEEVFPLDVIPISAKYSQNLRRVVGLMGRYVEDARDDLAHWSKSGGCPPPVRR